MRDIARHWRVLAVGVVAGLAGVVGLAGAPAGAQPLFPQPPVPSPVTVESAIQSPAAPSAAQLGVVSESAALPGGPALPTTVPGAAPAVVTAPTPTLLPASSGTIAEFFKAHNVAMQPQNPHDFTALKITLPMPPGWAYIPDPNVPDAYAVVADRVGGDGVYSSNAQVRVYKLVGAFNPDEAITHGFIDSQMLPAWRSTDASLARYDGMPSSLIEGTYRENSMSLNTSRRHVIAQSGPDHYLVSLSVTTTVDQAVAAADATEAIATGFKITSPTAQPAIAPPPPAPPAPPVPGLAPLPQPLGLP